MGRCSRCHPTRSEKEQLTKRGTPSHPKVLRLLQALGLSQNHTATAIGHLELLWHFTAQYAPRGDIGRYGDDQIEAALRWYGRRGRLVQALTTSGWVDVHNLCRLVVHDWQDHADEYVRKKLNRAGESFVTVTEKMERQNQTKAAMLGESVCQPAPSLAEPVPKPVPLPPELAAIVRSHAEFPETARAIRESYPATDDVFVMRLCSAVQQKVLSSTMPLMGEPSDDLIADAVRDCKKNSPNQTGPGLFPRTVPQCVLTWLTQGRRLPNLQEAPISEKTKKMVEFAAMKKRIEHAN